MALYGAIEAGGTKFVCAVGSDPLELRAQARFPTTSPAETLGRCLEFFRSQPQLDALGVGCFGHSSSVPVHAPTVMSRLHRSPVGATRTS